MKIPPPIRTTVPLLLLLFGVAFTLTLYLVLLSSNVERARQSVIDLARSESARLSGLATSSTKSEQVQRLTNDLGYLNEDPELKFAIVCDADFRVLRASAVEWEGRALDSTPAAFVRDVLDSVVKSSKSVLRVIDDREMVISAHARKSKGELVRITLVVRDTSNPLAEARRTAAADTLNAAGVLSVTLLLLWFAMHGLITMRLGRLMENTGIREGDANVASLTGADEFADISKSFSQAREELRTRAGEILLQTERYRRLVEMLPAIVVVNRNERIEFVNERGLEMLRATSKEQVLGRVIYEFIHPDYLGSTRRRLEQMLQSDEPTTAMEEKLIRLDGSTLNVEVAASAFRDQRGTAIQMVATDISERMENAAKREELSRDLQDKHKELETVLYVASHDLRSPLVNVMGFSRQLSNACAQLGAMVDRAREGTLDLEEMEPLVKTTIPRALKFIEQGVAKMDALLAGFLRFSRLGNASMEMKPINMSAMIKNILGTLTYQIQQTGAEVRLGELPSCVGDQTQINQVFTNLIDNAIKYHHPDRKSVISIEGRESDGKVTFSVTDNGIGIASAYVDKIFEIFHRLSPSLTQGEGLGLTIAQRIVKRHNGTISVESQPGEGTSFTVTLPAGDEPTSP